jgi:hypothetical protein
MRLTSEWSRRTPRAALLLLAVWPLASAEAHQGPVNLERLGKVEFKVSCNEAAQKEFNRGMALYRSFAWPHATAAFEAVL